eukprot:273510_1
MFESKESLQHNETMKFVHNYLVSGFKLHNVFACTCDPRRLRIYQLTISKERSVLIHWSHMAVDYTSIATVYSGIHAHIGWHKIHVGIQVYDKQCQRHAVCIKIGQCKYPCNVAN